jgi:hypothetical protein
MNGCCMAWLYVPGLPVSNSDSSSRSASVIELCVTSKGKPTLRLLSWRGWKARGWIALLSGTTLRPSTAKRGVASWISSLRASRVNLGRRQGSAKAEPTRDGCGMTSLASFARLDRESSFWKTSQVSLLTMESEAFSQTFPRAGSMRSGMCFRRRSSARRTAASAFSSWATPVASGTTGGKMESLLKEQIRLWRTPRAMESGQWQRSGKTGKLEATLAGQAAFFPTPLASDAKRYGNYGRGNPNLPGFVRQWRTPVASDAGREGKGSRDARGDLKLPGQALQHSLLRHRTPKGGSTSSKCVRVLNPLFVEMLMGLPTGWTELQQSATASFPSWLLTHSRLLRIALGVERCNT